MGGISRASNAEVEVGGWIVRQASAADGVLVDLKLAPRIGVQVFEASKGAGDRPNG